MDFAMAQPILRAVMTAPPSNRLPTQVSTPHLWREPMPKRDRKPIILRPEDFNLDEPILIKRKETETSDWAYQCNAPEGAKTPKPLEAFLRNMAHAQGGYAWQAV